MYSFLTGAFMGYSLRSSLNNCMIFFMEGPLPTSLEYEKLVPFSEHADRLYNDSVGSMLGKTYLPDDTTAEDVTTVKMANNTVSSKGWIYDYEYSFWRLVPTKASLRYSGEDYIETGFMTSSYKPLYALFQNAGQTTEFVRVTDASPELIIENEDPITLDGFYVDGSSINFEIYSWQDGDWVLEKSLSSYSNILASFESPVTSTKFKLVFTIYGTTTSSGIYPVSLTEPTPINYTKTITHALIVPPINESSTGDWESSELIDKKFPMMCVDVGSLSESKAMTLYRTEIASADDIDMLEFSFKVGDFT